MRITRIPTFRAHSDDRNEDPKIKAPATKKNHPELNLYSRAAKAAVGHKAKMLVGPVIFKVGE